MGADAAPPRVPDTMAQRVLACTGCHGAKGKASIEGFIPRIAGKPAAYLQRQLLSFRDGPRRHDGMARLLEGLPDGYLAEMATYFASLEPPPERPPRTPISAAATHRAEQLVRDGDPSANVPACTACHGERLSGRLPGVPGLAGLPRYYTLAQLGAWRIGLRKASAPDCMHSIAQALQPEDITTLADWLAAQPPAPPSAALTTPPPVACGGMSAP
ncbi:MAG: c-type cytochrome [Luteimonas sp.]|nr:c-type cytochrome [Luteimonas sp.]